MDDAALDPVVLEMVHRTIGPGSQFSLTQATQIHPGQIAQVLNYVQPWLRPCEAHSLSADIDQVRALPERLQELLGFNQATPYLGFIAGKHPLAWLRGD